MFTDTPESRILSVRPTRCTSQLSCIWLGWRIPLLDHASLHSHNHTLTHSHTLLITCTCCYDQIKGTQDKDFSYSFSDSLSVIYVVRRLGLSVCSSASLTYYTLTIMCTMVLGVMMRSKELKTSRSILMLMLRFSLCFTLSQILSVSLCHSVSQSLAGNATATDC